MDKFNRTNYYNSENVNAILEKDLITNLTNIFDDKSEYRFYTVKETDLIRPDLISYKIYGSHSYWWIIMKANDIEDVWNDLEVGQVLAIPSFADIEKYYDANKKKKQ